MSNSNTNTGHREWTDIEGEFNVKVNALQAELELIESTTLIGETKDSAIERAAAGLHQKARELDHLFGELLQLHLHGVEKKPNTKQQDQRELHIATIDAASLGFEALSDLRGLFAAVEKLAVDRPEIQAIARVGINNAEDVSNQLDCMAEDAQSKRLNLTHAPVEGTL